MNEYEQSFTNTPEYPGAGVNAKPRRRRMCSKRFSNVGQARVLAGFVDGMEKRLVAISRLQSQQDHQAIERIQKVDSYVQGLARSYLSTGKLPGWSKSLDRDIKQFFRLRQLLSQSTAHAMSIRLGHKVAEAALSAPRGPADYLASLINRTLKALGITTELVFNLEFVHGACRENHPLHIHGALCVPNQQLQVVTKALTRTLACGYRARWSNVAVLLDEVKSVGFWASYCVKESAVTAELLSQRGVYNKSVSYSSRRQSQFAKAAYARIEDWLSEE